MDKIKQADRIYSSLEKESQSNSEIASDVVNNFKEITGLDPKYVIDPDGSFLQDEISQTFPKIQEYVQDKYGVDLKNEDRIIRFIDEELMSSYADDAIAMYNEKAQEMFDEDYYDLNSVQKSEVKSEVV